MKSLLVFVTLALSAVAAPTTVQANNGQAGQAAGGLVGAVVNAVGNVGATGVKANVVDNKVGNYAVNGNKVDVLKRTDVTANNDQAGQALGGLVGAVGGVTGNVAATVADVDVECNDIGNDMLNNNDISVFRRQEVAANNDQAGQAASHGVAAVVGAILNAALKGVDLNVVGNNVANGVGNGNTVKVATRQEVTSNNGQQGAAAGGLAAVVAQVVGNLGLKGVDADVLYNNILNDVGNGNTVKVGGGLLPRTDAPSVTSNNGQASQAAGGLVGLDVNGIVNAVVSLVKATISDNNILNNVLDNNTIKVLSP